MPGVFGDSTDRTQIDTTFGADLKRLPDLPYETKLSLDVCNVNDAISKSYVPFPNAVFDVYPTCTSRGPATPLRCAPRSDEGTERQGAALETSRAMGQTTADKAQRAGPSPLADVAMRAGVSPMTVSRIVNGGPGLRGETRDRVMAAIDAVKYLPNHAARRLAVSEQIRLGVLYSNPSAGCLSEFLVGLLNEASRRHLQLVPERSEGSSAGQGTAAILNSGIDAVIIAPPLCDAPDLIDNVVASGKPDPRLCAVGVDDDEGAVCMTRHLIALGHQRIGFITGRLSQTATASRLNGWRRAHSPTAPG